jgi:arylsulfatase A-like enzyme
MQMLVARAGTVALVLDLGALAFAGGGGPPLPNVVLVNVDDLGYGDVGRYGATKVRTPHIDRLAEEGRRFTDFHAASAVCTPSRYALLTGRYPFRAGLWAPIFLKSPLVVDPEQLTIADVMKGAGYATAAIGKWHLGFGTQNPVDWNRELRPGPLELGFDYYFGVPVLNCDPPFVYVENHRVVGGDKADPLVYDRKADTRVYPEKFGYDEIGGARKAHALYVDDEVGPTLAQKAAEWIRAHKRDRFFLYLATTHVHHPFTPAARFVGTSEAGLYGDFVQELDWMVGEVTGALEAEGLGDDTLVILTSDNGAMLNQGGQEAWRLGHRMNGGLLGFKFDAWEGGHRVPFIARWPGHVPAGTESRALASNVDLLATLAAIVRRPLRDADAPDSLDFLPALLGDTKAPARDFLVVGPYRESNVAVRKGKWMYISAPNGGGFSGTKIGEHTLGGAAAHLLTGQVNSDIEKGQVIPDAPPAQLYDIEADPSERRNVYRDFPEVVEELRALLDETRRGDHTRPSPSRDRRSRAPVIGGAL